MQYPAGLLSTERVFDSEHPKTAAVLNEVVTVISTKLSEAWPLTPLVARTPLIKEVDSRGIDHLQAADMAAGWAREMLETGSLRALADKFEHVWVNGERLK